MNVTLKARLYKDSKKEWRWTLKRNHSRKVIGASTEGYKRRRDCVTNFELVTGLWPDFSYETGEVSAEWKVER